MMPVAELLEVAEAETWVDREQPTAWEEIEAKLSDMQDDSQWLATVRPDGRPHQRPIWAEWVTGALYFACGSTTVKGKHLARDTRCSISMHTHGVDLIIEGNARLVTDETELLWVRDAYASKGWTPTVSDGAFHDTFGAPTAGPPPFHVYRIEPTLAYGFPVQDAISPTRWRF
ncbi:MAG: pyridoxamine 5'-phosphate oxidase family protein [Nocardioidaceae bacterium]